MSTRTKPVTLLTFADTIVRPTTKYVGRVVAKCVPSAGDITFYLPKPADWKSFLIFNASGVNDLIVKSWQGVPWYGSTSRSITLADLGDALELRSNGSEWFTRNATTIIP